MLIRVALALLLSLSLIACETGSELPLDGDASIDAPVGGDSDDGTVEPDLGVPDVEVGDIPEPDLQTGDCPEGGGCFGEPCDTPADCFSGVCTMHLGDRVCSKTCDEDCPAGWLCSLVNLGGSDPVQVCLSQAGLLCRPCTTNDDCTDDSSEAPCVSYGEKGSFCGAACDDDNPCPVGYACEEATTADGGTSVQCVAESGECTCSETSTNLALSTACSVTSEWGTCEGLRRCSPDGLDDCDAQTPADDICNGLDDDCDGEVDEAGCDDGNPCTVDTCEGETGCVYTELEGELCDDEDACTEGDVCGAGACVGAPVVCDDDNGCTSDTCDGETGCLFEAASLACDDGDPCTLSDLCVDGACTPGVALDCDDQNPCTEDTCDGESGCDHTPNDNACDDGNACSSGDQCQGGLCQATATVVCDDGNSCTSDGCDLESGCEHLFNDQPCDDGDACTTGDQCAAGACGAGADVNCDDQNDCTDDSCHVALGCQHVPNAAPCDDLNPCTLSEHCAAKTCVATEALDCADDNPCTTDYCVPSAGCAHVPNSAPCDDEDVCTVGDLCVANGCQSSGESLVCDDGNPCTDDTCDPALGCIFVPNDAPCDDTNGCTTGDQCIEGLCVGAGILDCDDQNPCTKDSCFVGGDCLHEDLAGPCADGDPCTIGDQCIDGACSAGGPKSCDDFNPCTDDACGELGDCLHEDNEAGCDDQNPCTLGDHCTGGACKVEVMMLCNDQNPCTTDYCDPNLGCQASPSPGPCSDGDLCTLEDTCTDGACGGQSQLDCDDQNPCTTDSCDPELGCVHTDNDLGCDDQSACTLDDACSGGVCVGGAGPDCDDGNLCTADICDVADGCQHEPIALVCDDEDACTDGDQCVDSVCVGGDAVGCDDENVCTTDSCDALAGCAHVDNDLECEDGDACTTGDVCSGGICTTGDPVVCDDESVCTIDSCNVAGLCSFDPANDGLDCGGGKACLDGECSECQDSGVFEFGYTGDVQILELPGCVDTVTIETWGGQGGGAWSGGTCGDEFNAPNGGHGGYATGTLSVDPGTNLYIYVGASGQNGGYNGGGGNAATYPGSIGGGATDVRWPSNQISNRRIIAGGGGANAAYSDGCGGWHEAMGGAGGGDQGAPGQASNGNQPAAGGGVGGSQSQGGVSGADVNPIVGATGGSLGEGGLGGHGVDPGGQACGAAGGGGGGYYGGGGGGAHNCGGGGGGGGSSYIGGVTGASTQVGIHQGNGKVIISY